VDEDYPADLVINNNNRFLLPPPFYLLYMYLFQVIEEKGIGQIWITDYLIFVGWVIDD
jgi:hypothetical protein